MKRQIVYAVLLALFLVAACKKTGSEPSAEDNVTLEITVLKNGVPSSNIFVKVEAVIWKSTYLSGGVTRNEAYETSEDIEKITNNYGKTTFKYVDKSVPSRNGILIEKVTIKEGTTIVLEDAEEKVIEKNKTLKLTYEI